MPPGESCRSLQPRSVPPAVEAFSFSAGKVVGTERDKPAVGGYDRYAAAPEPLQVEVVRILEGHGGYGEAPDGDLLEKEIQVKRPSTLVTLGLPPLQQGVSAGSGERQKIGAADGSVQRRDTVSTVFLTPPVPMSAEQQLSLIPAPIGLKSPSAECM